MPLRLVTGRRRFVWKFAALGWALSACASPPPRAAGCAAPPAPKAPVATATPRPAFANPGGMWMPSQMPEQAETLKSLGLGIDPALLSDPKSSVLGAIVNLNGCSASFVSKDGLVATNHHCSTLALQRNSTPQAEPARDRVPRQEPRGGALRGPGMRLTVLSSMTDVTAKVRPVLQSIVDDLAPKARARPAGEGARRRLRKGRPGVRCGFVALYEGLRYFVIETLEIRDVRIVWAPAEGIGNFGGEVDNWRWPRHCGDVALFRAYVGKDGLPADYSPDNVPHKPPSYLRLATTPLAENDLVFVAGYPGHTSLLSPSVEMREVVHDVYPERLAMFDAYLGLLEGMAKDDPEIAIKGARWLRGFSNYRTKHKGELEGLTRAGLLQKKLDQEKALAAYIAGDPKRSAGYGTLLADLEAAYREAGKTRVSDTALEREMLMPRLLFAAYRIARIADERQKPDAARDPAYQDRNVPKLKDELKAMSSQIYEKLDRAILKLALQRDRARSPETRTPPWRRSPAPTPATRAWTAPSPSCTRRPSSPTKRPASSCSTRPSLKISQKARTPSCDSSRSSTPSSRAVEGRRKRFQGKMLIQMPRFMEMLLGFKGGAVAPDANGTLRLAYGTVQKRRRARRDRRLAPSPSSPRSWPRTPAKIRSTRLRR